MVVRPSWSCYTWCTVLQSQFDIYHTCCGVLWCGDMMYAVVCCAGIQAAVLRLQQEGLRVVSASCTTASGAQQVTLAAVDPILRVGIAQHSTHLLLYSHTRTSHKVVCVSGQAVTAVPCLCCRTRPGDAHCAGLAQERASCIRAKHHDGPGSAQ